VVTCGKARPSEFLDIAALDRTAWQRNRRPDFIPDGEHAWRQWVEHALTFCARERGNIVGVILAFPCLSGVFCLHKVFVAENFHGRGIATRLFAKLLTEIDRRGAVCFLTVDPANDAALALYAGMGFSRRRFVKGYYRKTEDRWVLTRSVLKARTRRDVGAKEAREDD